MCKQEFLNALQARLACMPCADATERLAFYSEMIDDRIEEGLPEEEAVAAVGSVEEIAAQILAEIPLSKLMKERIRPRRRLSALEIVLLVLGAPVWLSILISAFAVVLSLYVFVWSVVGSLWAIFGALAGSVFGGMVAGVALSFGGSVPVGLVLLGAAMAAAGLSILSFFGCKWATFGGAWLTKQSVLCIKRCFVRREAHHA